MAFLKYSFFGSVARGENASQSDVDFLVELPEGNSLFGIAGFCFEVEQLLGVRVDAVPTRILPQIKDLEFVNNIRREAISL